MSTISPLAGWANILVTASLFGVVAALDLYGHITERTALRAYTALTGGVILFITLTGTWWALALALPAAMIFIWALTTIEEEDT